MIRIFKTNFKNVTPFTKSMTQEIMDKLITHNPNKILDRAIIYNLKIVSLNTTFYTNIFLPKDKYLDTLAVSKLHYLLSYSPVKTIDIIDGNNNVYPHVKQLNRFNNPYCEGAELDWLSISLFMGMNPVRVRML